jgi:hypothetical protein
VYVGKERKAYKLHKELLISKCSYFRASLSSGFPEGRNNEVHLSDDEPAAFNFFVRWLYIGSVSSINDRKDVSVAARAYIMADAFLMVELKNDLMDTIRHYYTLKWMGSETLAILAEHETFHGQLKRFVLDQIAHNLLNNFESDNKPSPYLPQGDYRAGIDTFLATGNSTAVETFWALQQFALKKYDDPAMREGCHYHEHPAGSPACKFVTKKDEGKS